LLAAWYETAVLIGKVDLGGLGRVWITGLLNLTTFITIAFLLTCFLRSIGIATTIAIVLVLASSILKTWPSVARWSPVAFSDQARIYAAGRYQSLETRDRLDRHLAGRDRAGSSPQPMPATHALTILPSMGRSLEPRPS